MPRTGPKRKVSDLRLLFELLVSGEYTFASEVQDQVGLEAVQSVRDRLNSLVNKTGYVKMKKASGRNLYRLTDAGRAHVLEEVRAVVE